LLFTGSCVQKPQVSRPECYKEVRRSAYSNRGTQPSAQKVSFLSRMLQNILPFFIQQLCSDSKFFAENVTKQSSIFHTSNLWGSTICSESNFLVPNVSKQSTSLQHGTLSSIQTVSFLSRMLQKKQSAIFHTSTVWDCTICSESRFLVQNVTKQQNSLPFFIQQLSMRHLLLQ
jgi:hypothetical protein